VHDNSQSGSFQAGEGVSREVIQRSKEFLLQNYARADVVFERGEGVYLVDAEGERYLDCVSGLAVNALGYGDADVLEALREQSRKLIHVSNLYYTIPAASLAEELVRHSFADRVFFCNSGTEANEACIKFARRWARTHFGENKTGLVAAFSSFHGRTMGSISLTGQEKYQAPFEPLVPGIRFARFNDIDHTVEQINDNTAAVFLEPVQAEGGVHPATQEYLKAVRSACDTHNALLVFDEVQVGLGRTGRLFCHEHYGVEPDMLTLAKPLAGGLPIGAALLKQHVADAIQPGDHAATFGGGPLICAVALVVFRKIADPQFLEKVRNNSALFGGRLRALKEQYSAIRQVRGMGMIWGVQFDEPAAPIVAEFRKRHILACVAGPNVLRFLPPLVIGEEELNHVADVFADILEAR